MQFVAYGHQNIEGTHKSALELTQHTSVLPRGDRVIGTRAAFDAEAIAGLAQVSSRLKITLQVGSSTETIIGTANKQYNPAPHIIIRKDSLVSPQTLLIHADKAAADLPKKFIDLLKSPEAKLTVIIERL